MTRTFSVLAFSLFVLLGVSTARADNWKSLLSYEGSGLGHYAILLEQGEIGTVASLLEGEVERGTALQEIALYAYLVQGGIIRDIPDQDTRAVALARQVLEASEAPVDGALARLVLARAFAFGMGVEPDLRKAMEHLRAAKEVRIPEAFIQAAVLASRHEELGHSEDEIRLWLRRASEFGNPDAHAIEALMMLEGRLSSRFEQVETALVRGIEAGSDLAAYHYAILLMEGEFGADRETEGFERLERLAGRGYPEANNLLAEIILMNRWGAESEARTRAAVRMLELAADAGLLRARMNLGLIHAWGLGVAYDPDLARAHLERAIRAGFVPAAGALGGLLMGDTLGEPDPVEGKRLLLLAAEEGDTLAQHDLGLSYLNSVVEPNEDVVMGLAWLEIASRSNEIEIAETYLVVANQYNRVVLEAAVRTAEACIAAGLRNCRPLMPRP